MATNDLLGLQSGQIVVTKKTIEIVWDKLKRQANLAIPFEFFLTVRIASAKAGRYQALGLLAGRPVVVIFKRLGSEAFSLISLRPASAAERKETMTARARKTKAGYGKADIKAVSDNPAWTGATTARSKSFDEAFPDIVRRARGPQKAPTKKQITLRLDARVVEHFKATGDGWQSRINEALKRAAGL